MRKVLVLVLALTLFALPIKSYAVVHPFVFAGYLAVHHGHHFMGAVGGKVPFMSTGAGVATFFSPVIIAAIWHIPAWEQAKANHTEAAYQAQQMWPQQFFAKLGKVQVLAND
jgi:hypothetical protein